MCTVRFNIGQTGAVALTGSAELHFGDVEDLWLVTDGRIDLLARVFGIGAKHMALDVRYDRFMRESAAPRPTVLR
jgi:hypothetical protein